MSSLLVKIIKQLSTLFRKSQSDMGCDTCDSCDGCFLCLVHVYVCTRVDEVIDFAVTAVTAVTKSLLFLYSSG